MRERHSTAVLIALLVLVTSTSAAALTIPWETRTGHNSSGSTSWSYSYDIGLFNDVLMIDVDIAFIGARPGATLRNRWESGIEDIWSTDEYSVPIEFNVDWVKVGRRSQDQVVTVTRGPGPWNLRNWYMGNPSGWGNRFHEEIAAHEFGHMVGLFDEYEGAPLDPRTGRVNTGGLMDTLDGPTLDHYYETFLVWYDERVDDPLAPVVTEPETVLLLGAGVIALLVLPARSIREPARSAPRTSRRPIGPRL